MTISHKDPAFDTQSENYNTTQPAPQTTDTKSYDHQFKTRFSTINFTSQYPEENPSQTVRDITDALQYLGYFDGIIES